MSSRSGSSGPPEPARLSFGVELEFLIACAPYDRETSDDDHENMHKAIGLKDSIIPEIWQCQQQIEDMLAKEALVMHPGGPTRVFQDKSLKESKWNVSSDSSLVLPDGLDIDSDTYLGAKWTAIEIQSPALWDEPESWQEIDNVCQLLQDRFWTITPHCTGLHFHVGCGPDNISLRNLRRTATLLFAADPILVQLHPPHRKTRSYCLSNRTFSAVAQGKTASTAKIQVDELLQGRKRETNETWELIDSQRERSQSRSPESANQKSESPRPGSETFDRKIPRGELTGYPYTPGQPVNYPNDPDQVPAPVDMHQCTKELTKASSRGAVALLMENARQAHERLAYNFSNFDEFPHSQDSRKKTIEFRQSAGSLEANEVVTFGMIFVEICNFAINSSYQQFWSVVHKCIATEKLTIDGQSNSGFDVFDLLLSMKLGDEATVLQDLLQARPRQPDNDGSLREFGSGGDDLSP